MKDNTIPQEKKWESKWSALLENFDPNNEDDMLQLVVFFGTKHLIETVLKATSEKHIKEVINRINTGL